MNSALPTLRAGDLAPAEMLGLLAKLTYASEEPVRCWLDAFDGWALDYWPGSTGTVRWNGAGREPRVEALEGLLPRVTSGRVFASSGELKWRVLPSLGERCWRSVFLGNRWPLDGHDVLPVQADLTALSPEQAIYPLWGQQTKRTPGEWIDLRIPHRLRYPVSATAPEHGRVIAKIVVEVWKDIQGEPQFARLCDLRADWEK